MHAELSAVSKYKPILALQNQILRLSILLGLDLSFVAKKRLLTSVRDPCDACTQGQQSKEKKVNKEQYSKWKPCITQLSLLHGHMLSSSITPLPVYFRDAQISSHEIFGDLGKEEEGKSSQVKRNG